MWPFRATNPDRSRTRRAQCSRRINTESLESRQLLSAVTFDSLTGIGNGDSDSSAKAVDADQYGNSYVTGKFMGTVDFGPSEDRPDGSDILTARGQADIYVAKYAADGSLIWVVQFGGSDPQDGFNEAGGSIEVATSGVVFVGGRFSGSASFGSQTLVSSGGTDVFVAKLNSAGAVQWARKWGTAAQDFYVGMDVDSAGNVHAVSERSDAMTIKKFNTNGSELWSKAIPTKSKHPAGDIAVDGTGNIFVTGMFSGTVDFDPGKQVKNSSANPLNTYGASYVLSLSSQGNFRWVSQFTGQQSPNGHLGTAFPATMTVDNGGKLLVGGWKSGLIDFQPSSATVLSPDGFGGFIVSLNPSSGYLNWTKTFDAASTSGTIYVSDLDTDLAGNIYAAGAFSDTADFDPGVGVDLRSPVGVGGTTDIDAYYMKLSSTGDLLWVETLGGTGQDWANGIAVDSSGGINVVGNLGIGSTIDFDPDPLTGHFLTTVQTKGFRLRVRQDL